VEPEAGSPAAGSPDGASSPDGSEASVADSAGHALPDRVGRFNVGWSAGKASGFLVGGLLTAARAGWPLTVVVLDDDGGGIFSHLPVARLGEAAGFERLFRTPHGRDLGRLCHGLELDHVRVSSREHLRATLKDALSSPDASLVEVPVDAERNLEQHRRVRRAVAEALAGADRPALPGARP